MSKDLEDWLCGGYLLGGMAFIVWFMNFDTPAFRLLTYLARRPGGRALMFPLIFVYWIFWPLTLAGLGILALKRRDEADA